MSKRLVIFGTGSQARLAHHYFTRDSDYEVEAFTVDGGYATDTEFLGLPLVPFAESASTYPPGDFAMFVAIGYTRMNRLRAEKYTAARALGYEMATYVSSRCTYLSDHPPGDNCMILEDNTIQPFVRIGDDVTIWSGNHVGHDAVIGDHVFISSHVVISGFVRIEPYCFLGVNATLRDDITIAEANLIGAGAVIMKSTQPHEVWVPPRSTRVDIRSDGVNL
jgi:sugar O-acyltransferase (sialic acid O-acetyltransferase NeuD family)